METHNFLKKLSKTLVLLLSDQRERIKLSTYTQPTTRNVRGFNPLFAHLLDSLVYDGVVSDVRQGNVVLTRMRLVKLDAGFNRVLVSCPGTTGNAAHNVPDHRNLEDFVDTRRAVKHHAKAAVDCFADAGTAAVVQSDQAHAAGTVACEALPYLP